MLFELPLGRKKPQKRLVHQAKASSGLQISFECTCFAIWSSGFQIRSYLSFSWVTCSITASTCHLVPCLLSYNKQMARKVYLWGFKVSWINLWLEYKKGLSLSFVTSRGNFSHSPIFLSFSFKTLPFDKACSFVKHTILSRDQMSTEKSTQNTCCSRVQIYFPDQVFPGDWKNTFSGPEKDP